MDKATEANRTNQCNPNHGPTGPGKLRFIWALHTLSSLLEGPGIYPHWVQCPTHITMGALLGSVTHSDTKIDTFCFAFHLFGYEMLYPQS
jgi:hypothetical protein